MSRDKIGWRDRDHTRGSLIGSLTVLALPMLLSSIGGGVVFQLVDLTFISRLGEVPMASVIIVNQSVRQIIFMLVMGGSFGTQALIAREIGAGRVDVAERVAGQAVLLGVCFSAVVAASGALFPEFLFSLPAPDPAFREHGIPYLQLIFLLNFGVVGSLLFGAILGGAGDTTTPLFVMLIQTAVAISAEWLLIFGNLGAPELGVRGVAIGIACGQITAMTIGMTVLFRGKSRVHLRRSHLVPDLAMLRHIAKLSWPPALQFLGGLASTVAFLRLAGEFGAQVQAAYAIGLRLGMIVPAVCFPLATAIATLVGQSLGAGNIPRAWEAIRTGVLVHGSVMFGFALITLFFREPILRFFTDDPKVVQVGTEYLLYSAGAFVMWAFYFPFLRALQGAGDVFVPMAISLGTTFLVAVPLANYLAHHTDMGPSGIWTAFLVSSAVSTVATGLWLATGRWTRRHRQAA